MRLSQLGELGLLAELERRGLILGVEHDAAQLGDGLVVTQDVLVEGIHFRLDWLTWRELGFRAAAVNLSDLAASGATPEALLVTFAAPASTSLAVAVALYEGIAETGVAVVGGDTSSAADVVVGVTAIDCRAAAVTVSTVEPVTPFIVALIVDVPAAKALARPAAVMVATEVVAEAQVTWLVRFCVELSV